VKVLHDIHFAFMVKLLILTNSDTQLNHKAHIINNKMAFNKKETKVIQEV